jgi:hypothetical protein
MGVFEEGRILKLAPQLFGGVGCVVRTVSKRSGWDMKEIHMTTIELQFIAFIISVVVIGVVIVGVIIN